MARLLQSNGSNNRKECSLSFDRCNNAVVPCFLCFLFIARTGQLPKSTNGRFQMLYGGIDFAPCWIGFFDWASQKGFSRSKWYIF